MDFKSLVGVKVSVTENACKNHVFFIRLRCARRSDVMPKNCSKNSLFLQNTIFRGKTVGDKSAWIKGWQPMFCEIGIEDKY